MTARVQMRVGPPFLQPFFDIGKLLIKETCVPAGGAIGLFLIAPLIGLAAAALASMILWRSLLDPQATFIGDLIVLLYLLAMPGLTVILGASSSRNPLASLGAGREMKLMIAYELPFVLAVLVPVIQVHSIRLGDLLAATPASALPSGLLALLVAMVCMQAKLTVTSIVVTHDVPSMNRIATRAALLFDGKIRFIGTPEEFNSSDDPVVRQFIRGESHGPITDEEAPPG